MQNLNAIKLMFLVLKRNKLINASFLTYPANKSDDSAKQFTKK